MNEFSQLISQIFSWSLRLVGLAVLVNFIWAGFIRLSAAGRPAKVSEAREKMLNSVIGGLILFAAYLILNTINPDLVRQTFTLPSIR